MVATILNGKQVASGIKTELKASVDALVSQNKRVPGLAVILVGEDPASRLYVKRKYEACLQVGFQSFAYHLPHETTEKELLSLITQLNHQVDVDGILVQLPLPTHIHADIVIEQIHPAKDVDGFHPYNFGRLAQGRPLLRPCTPYGIMQLMKAYELPIRGKKAVVIGASNIVGRPMGLELILAGVTVSICHSLTKDLQEYVSLADIIVSATGVRHLINPSWLKPHQIVIDVGIHHLDNHTICGDIDFDEASQRVGFITPVPGGVGPMTVATLLQNTFDAFKRA